MYGVNFTSAFHTHARRSALMDFHLSPLPTHPALIIRGMRTTSAQGMPGYAVEFMTSTETDTPVYRTVQDNLRRSRRNRRRLSARGIILTITPQLDALRRGRDRRSKSPSFLVAASDRS